MAHIAYMVAVFLGVLIYFLFLNNPIQRRSTIMAIIEIKDKIKKHMKHSND
jgi:hypothetical protein